MPGKRALRASVRATATVTTGGERLRCRIVNLSASGMAIETDTSRNLGRFVHVTTELDSGSPRIDLDAMVVRRELGDQRIVWGLSFHELPSKFASIIESYVHGRSSKG